MFTGDIFQFSKEFSGFVIFDLWLHIHFIFTRQSINLSLFSRSKSFNLQSTRFSYFEASNLVALHDFH